MKAAVISIVAKHALRIMDGEPEIHGEEVGFCRPTRYIRFILKARKQSSAKSKATKPIAESSATSSSVDNDIKKVSAPTLTGDDKPQGFEMAKGGLASQSMIIKETASQQSLQTAGTNMLVLYGSQSGKSKEFAERFAKIAELTEMIVNSCCIADYSLENLPQMKLVVVITSTYGQGEPPENAVPLCTWLNQSHPLDILTDLQYAVLRLGSSGTGTLLLV